MFTVHLMTATTVQSHTTSYIDTTPPGCLSKHAFTLCSHFSPHVTLPYFLLQLHHLNNRLGTSFSVHLSYFVPFFLHLSLTPLFVWLSRLLQLSFTAHLCSYLTFCIPDSSVLCLYQIFISFFNLLAFNSTRTPFPGTCYIQPTTFQSKEA